MATPVLADLKALVLDYDRRLTRGSAQVLETRRIRLSAAARGLPRPADILGLASQRYDLAAGRLAAGLERNAAVHERDLTRVSARLNPALLRRPERLRAERLRDISLRLDAAVARAQATAARRAALPALSARLVAALARRLDRAQDGLIALDKLRQSLDPNRPLQRGFARVHHGDGRLVRFGADLAVGEAIELVFADQAIAAIVDGAPRAPADPAKRGRPSARAPRRGAQTHDVAPNVISQGDLF
jgi:exodeoxyribonuclease VII large subunit